MIRDFSSIQSGKTHRAVKWALERPNRAVVVSSREQAIFYQAKLDIVCISAQNLSKFLTQSHRRDHEVFIDELQLCGGLDFLRSMVEKYPKNIIGYSYSFPYDFDDFDEVVLSIFEELRMSK